MLLRDIMPHVRYVNDYAPDYTYVEKERIIYDHELMYIMGGQVEMHYGGSVYQLRKGDLFHLSPGVPNHIAVAAEDGLRTHCIHFDFMPLGETFDFTAEEYYIHSVLSPDHQEKLMRLLNRPDPVPEDFQLPPLTRGIPYETLAPLFDKCWRAFVTPTASGGLRARAALMEILALLASRTEEMSGLIHPRIAQAMAYIKANYRENITVAELASRFDLSPKHFGRMFHAAAGRSVRAFLMEIRLFAAREMLIGTALSIETVAHEAGFGDAFYFSRCFRKAEGVSPSEYRLLMQP